MTHLFVLKLYQILIIDHNLIPLTDTLVKQLRQRKPLARHLVSIVRINKLVVIHAVRRISLHAVDGWFAAVERDHIVDEGLASGGEREGFRWVRSVVFCAGGLARLEVFAGGGSVRAEVRGAGVGGWSGHGGGCGCEGAGRGWVVESSWVESAAGYESFG